MQELLRRAELGTHAAERRLSQDAGGLSLGAALGGGRTDRICALIATRLRCWTQDHGQHRSTKRVTHRTAHLSPAMVATPKLERAVPDGDRPDRRRRARLVHPEGDRPARRGQGHRSGGRDGQVRFSGKTVVLHPEQAPGTEMTGRFGKDRSVRQRDHRKLQDIPKGSSGNFTDRSPSPVEHPPHPSPPTNGRDST